ncbi:MAG: Hsp20/alpha crystallin family protein [Candidatus Omnitrophica bacterium]|nr:Hsp20/alpha crystallin family protein [Candidatus Omnitrophota bacterium]
MAAVILTGLLLAGLGFSETAPKDDTTAQDLWTLRKKLSRVKREMDLLIKDMVSGASMASDAVLKGSAGDVSVDILQDEKFVIVKADLPGMEKDKINITLESGRFLKISGSREILKSQTAPGVVKQERFSGSFEKTVELPCEVENFGIGAIYKDGVLEITIPKKAAAKENRVKISVK